MLLTRYLLHWLHIIDEYASVSKAIFGQVWFHDSTQPKKEALWDKLVRPIYTERHRQCCDDTSLINNQWSRLRMGLQPILESLHSFQ